MPTYLRSATSCANASFSSSRSMAWPPHLMTRILPVKRRMYGSASRSVSALLSTGSTRGLCLAVAAATTRGGRRSRVVGVRRASSGFGAEDRCQFCSRRIGPALRLVVLPAARFVEPTKMPRSTVADVLRLSVLETVLGVVKPAWTLHVSVPATLQSTISVYSVFVVTDELGTVTQVAVVPPPLQQRQTFPGLTVVSKPTPTKVMPFDWVSDKVRAARELEAMANQTRRLVMASTYRAPSSSGR